MVWVESLLRLISLIFCTKNQTILKICLLSDSQINLQKTSYSKTESCCIQQAKHLCSSLHTYLLRTHEINKQCKKVFKSFRSKHGDHYNFSIFAQGHFIKILSQGARHFYAFDSHLSPKEFLVSKGIIVE